MVVDVGCGTGVLSRELATSKQVGRVIGIDHCEGLLRRAQEEADRTILFVQGDAHALPLPGAVADLVLFHTTLTHVANIDLALSEAMRILTAGGRLIVFDGDYSSTTLAVGDDDPLQACVGAWAKRYVCNIELVTQLPRLIQGAGFQNVETESFSYEAGSANPDRSYFLSIADRGVDALVDQGAIGVRLGVELKREARRRVQEGQFYGSIEYFLARACKPS